MSDALKPAEEYAAEMTGGPNVLLRQFQFESSAEARVFHARILAIFTRCQRDAVEACAKVADSWALNYPVTAFPESGESIDCRSAHHGRHSSRIIAEYIRALVSP